MEKKEETRHDSKGKGNLTKKRLQGKYKGQEKAKTRRGRNRIKIRKDRNKGIG